MKGTVAIGLSGGVDSSVAALLLKEQGYKVFGLFMINWKDITGTLSGDCPWKDDQLLAEMVARKLGIPLYTVDFSEEYRQRVVDYMFAEYQAGRTPNPDVLCNREVKFDLFLKHARESGADFIATGHYCRKETIAESAGTVHRLLAGIDPNKDQSYFLCQLSQEQLAPVLFPIGHLHKPEVRKIASEAGLPTAERKDSQGICFVGKVDLPVFLQQKLAARQGDIIEIPADSEIYKQSPNDLYNAYSYSPLLGNKVGSHNGAQFYTIGQNKGLNIGGRPQQSFVIGIDTVNNILYTGNGGDHPGLYRTGLFIRAEDCHWIRNDLRAFPGETRKYQLRIRYRQSLQAATIQFSTEGARVLFEKPQRGITSGQFAAWYDGEELIGSGVIQ
ncbi:MAG: tRNA 2-thiouridine(34) synthase MnmA [Bacteroidales bacterium]